jgi:hypothetical protein
VASPAWRILSSIAAARGAWAPVRLHHRMVGKLLEFDVAFTPSAVVLHAGWAQYEAAWKNHRAMSSWGRARPPIHRLMIFPSRQCFSTSPSLA